MAETKKAVGNIKTTIGLPTDKVISDLYVAKSDIETDIENATVNTKVAGAKAVKDAIDSKADALDIPTKTSDLTNDSGFITNANLPTKVSDLTNDVPYLIASDITGKEDKTNKVSSWSSTTNNTRYPSEKLVKDSLDGKVDKVNGKGLSTNDYTNDDKSKIENLRDTVNDEPNDLYWLTYYGGKASLIGLESGVFTYTDDGLSVYYSPGNSSHSDDYEIANHNYVQEYVDNELDNISYYDLSNTPTNLSDFTNDEYFITSSDITGKEDNSNKVSSWSSTTNNTRYPSEKLVKDSLDTKISKSSTTGLVKNDGTIDTTQYLTSADITDKIEIQVLASASDLPATGSANVFYFVPSTSSETQNAYDEYVWVNGAYEKVGVQKVDLTGYVKVSELKDHISGEITSTGDLNLIFTY